jgi:para-nitrobenzyl esterase
VAEAARAAQPGTLHGFEIAYTRNIMAARPQSGAATVSDSDRAMGGTASDYWTTFGLTGDPNGGGRPAWPRHDPAVDRVLNFTNDGVTVGPDPLRARLDLWQAVWEQGGF